jgi:hypothetical protein
MLQKKKLCSSKAHPLAHLLRPLVPRAAAAPPELERRSGGAVEEPEARRRMGCAFLGAGGPRLLLLELPGRRARTPPARGGQGLHAGSPPARMARGDSTG